MELLLKIDNVKTLSVNIHTTFDLVVSESVEEVKSAQISVQRSKRTKSYRRLGWLITIALAEK